MMKKKAFEKNTDKFHINERDHVIPQNVTIGVAKSQKRNERPKKKKSGTEISELLHENIYNSLKIKLLTNRIQC